MYEYLARKITQYCLSLQSYVDFFLHKSDYVSGHAFVPSHSSNQAFILIQFVHFRLAWTI